MRAALFALRQFDMGPIQEAFARFGVTLTRQPGAHLRQRQFVSQDEHTQAVKETEKRGLTPPGWKPTAGTTPTCSSPSPDGSSK
ncbi:hypothetical protein [Nesterenkonia pannonica]|uniref:hypothetical protein n=1 Tax=Nesterenkonia pannonica TaxID=1548602 RepID=UPI002164C9BF|nr:hypothetical protein [Nesterenkonia pannonica]